MTTGTTKWQDGKLTIDRQEFVTRLRACRKKNRGAPANWCADHVVRNMAHGHDISPDVILVVELDPPAMLPEEV